jgi:hypothetical protein
MSGLDEGHHDNDTGLDDMEEPPPPKLKARRSMDLEFHDLYLDVWNESEHSMSNIKRSLSARNGSRLSCNDGDGSSSFDDSFGEASDDEEPDKQYLEELLDDEYHPERLNLLDNNVPSRKKKPQLQRKSGGDGGGSGMKHAVPNSDGESQQIENTTVDDGSDWSRDHSDTSSDIRQDFTYDLSDHTGTQDDDSSEISGWNPDGDANDSDSTDQGEQPGADDAFGDSPKRRIDPSRPTIKSQMERLGTSTKRSFRTVGNRPFFSQPFKGLSRSLSGGKRKPRKLLEQQEVA